MQSSTSSNDSVLDANIAQAASASSVHAHEHGPDLRMFGFSLFLVSEGMLFVGLFVAYFAFRASAPAWPPAGTPELEKFMPSVFTAILVASSGVIYLADRALLKGDMGKFRLFWGLTTLMGLIFLGGQAYEWANLTFTLKSGLYGGTFYVLTGFHGMHVIIGIILQIIMLIRSFKAGRYTPESHYGPAATSVYWHFVDVVWVALFGMLYIL
ncbi:MAG: heme-copper oxidase subunit III [Anaerolineae bacterium]|nr:heme-copper oxidase subunit III [Gloeobacterales cyanobacterium ES-bin-313]